MAQCEHNHALCCYKSHLCEAAYSTPTPSIPVPEYPGGQAVQWYPGDVFTQRATGLQGLASVHCEKGKLRTDREIN